MARAKRTDRTAARRRHRADQAALAGPGPDDEGTDAPSTSSASRSQRTEQVARPSIMAAFRGAVRPLDLRTDLRSLRLVVLNWGFLVALAVSAVLAVWYVVAYSGAMSAMPVGTVTADQLQAILTQNSAPYMLYTMVLNPPAVIGAFLIGFTAKRASWLGGLLYGIFAVILATIVAQTPAGRILAFNGVTNVEGPVEAVVIANAAWSPLGAALFASAAAWYKRFLDLASPNRGQRGQPKSPRTQGRGNMKPVRR